MKLIFNTLEKQYIHKVIDVHKKSKQKLCVFAHFDKTNTIQPYVLAYLKSLAKLNFDIILVTTSQVLGEDVRKVKPHVYKIIIRDNIGYDFLSYKIGLISAGSCEQYRQVLFCNDSIIFPLYPPDEMFEVMQNRGYDFWGITANQFGRYHIQSFFWVFSEKIIKSDIFKQFWESVTNKNKADIIQDYEINLTARIKECGFTTGTYIDNKNIVGQLTNVNRTQQFFSSLDPTYYLWDKIIKYGKAPFIKKNLFLQGTSLYSFTASFWASVLDDALPEKQFINLFLKHHSKSSPIPSQLKISYANFNQAIMQLILPVKKLPYKNGLVFYGARQLGVILYKLINETDNLIVDRDYHMLNTAYHLDIKPPEVIDCFNIRKIIICSLLSCDVIKKSLLERGVQRQQIMCLSENIDTDDTLKKLSITLNQIFKMLDSIVIFTIDNKDKLFLIYTKNALLVELMMAYLNVNGFNTSNIRFVSSTTDLSDKNTMLIIMDTIERDEMKLCSQRKINYEFFITRF